MKKIEYVTFDVELYNTDLYNQASKAYDEKFGKSIMHIWYPSNRPQTSFKLVPKELKEVGKLKSELFEYVHFKIDDTYYISNNLHDLKNASYYRGNFNQKRLIIEDGDWYAYINLGYDNTSLEKESCVLGNIHAVDSKYSFKDKGETETILLLTNDEILLSTKNENEFNSELNKLKKIVDDELSREDLHVKFCNLITTLCDGEIKKVGKLNVSLVKKSHHIYHLYLSYKGITVFQAFWDGGQGEISYYFTRKGKWEEDIFDNFNVAVNKLKIKKNNLIKTEEERINNILSTY